VKENETISYDPADIIADDSEIKRIHDEIHETFSGTKSRNKIVDFLMVNRNKLEVPLYAEPCGVKEDYYILFLNLKYNFQSKIIMPSIVSLGNSLKKDNRLRLYYVNKRSKQISYKDSNRPLSSLTPLDLLTKKLPRRKPSTNSQSKKNC